MNAYDVSEVIDALRAHGYVELDILQVIEGLQAGSYELSDVADLVQAMDEGDDDEAFMRAAWLGLA